MQLAALSCVLYVMQYIISIIHSYSSVDYGLQVLYWTRRIRAAGVLKIKRKVKKRRQRIRVCWISLIPDEITR